MRLDSGNMWDANRPISRPGCVAVRESGLRQPRFNATLSSRPTTTLLQRLRRPPPLICECRHADHRPLPVVDQQTRLASRLTSQTVTPCKLDSTRLVPPALSSPMMLLCSQSGTQSSPSSSSLSPSTSTRCLFDTTWSRCQPHSAARHSR